MCPTGAENGRIPNKEEVKSILKESFNLDVKNEEYMCENTMMSIDEEVSEDYSVENSSIFNDFTACYNDYEAQSDRESSKTELDDYLSILSEEEADILRMKFGVGEYENMPCSNDVIAEKYNINPARVDKIIEHSMDYMRQNIKRHAV